MVQISGRYQVVENRNFYELLTGVGVPEETAKERSQNKGILEVTVDGGNVRLANEAPPHVANLVAGKEVEERMGEVVFRSTANIDNNVISITSTKDGSPSGSRTLTFTDSGLEFEINASKDGKTYSATRIYKRI